MELQVVPQKSLEKNKELPMELERINREPKGRTRVVGAFPSDQSFMRLDA